jgi:hypothetical protein
MVEVLQMAPQVLYMKQVVAEVVLVLLVLREHLPLPLEKVVMDYIQQYPVQILRMQEVVEEDFGLHLLVLLVLVEWVVAALVDPQVFLHQVSEQQAVHSRAVEVVVVQDLELVVPVDRALSFSNTHLVIQPIKHSSLQTQDNLECLMVSRRLIIY